MTETSPTRRQLREAAQAKRTGGLAQAGADDFSLEHAVGGPRGVVEALLPGLLYVVVYTATRELTPALVVSVGAAVLALVLRLVTRSSPSQALAGAVGVAVCAFFADRTGDARNFYVPGLLTNVGYGLAYLLSTIPFRRFTLLGTRIGPGPYPVLGLVIGLLTGEGMRWRRDPRRLQAYQRVTWLWAGMFALRLAVQLPLYFTDQVGVLGVARLAMGVPLFALTVWLTWVILKAVPPARHDDQATRPDEEPVDEDTAEPLSLESERGVSRGQGSAVS